MKFLIITQYSQTEGSESKHRFYYKNRYKYILIQFDNFLKENLLNKKFMLLILN